MWTIRKMLLLINERTARNVIISIVRAALVDDEANVRSAAARAFDVLQEELGAKAIDQNYPDFVGSITTTWKRLRNCASSIDRSHECTFSFFFFEMGCPDSFRSELPLFSLF